MVVVLVVRLYCMNSHVKAFIDMCIHYLKL